MVSSTESAPVTTPSPSPVEPVPSPPVKPSFTDRLKKLFEDYGPVGFLVWWVIFAVVFAGFYVAIRKGYQPTSGAGGAGVLGVAYLATQATKPLRLAATLALTPVIGRWWKARKKKGAAEKPEITP